MNEELAAIRDRHEFLAHDAERHERERTNERNDANPDDDRAMPQTPGERGVRAVSYTHLSGGVATLTGSVRTPAARAKTVAAARSVKGIHEVRDQLHIDSRVPDIGQRLSDAALAGRIAGAIFTQTGTTGVKVDVHDGAVTLRGAIVDPKVRSAAVDTARNTSGVRSVTDDMGS